MTRLRCALILGLVFLAADKQALILSAASRPVNTSTSVQVILRLADPPVSALSAAPRPGRSERTNKDHARRPLGSSRAASLSELTVSREQEYCRRLKGRQESLARRITSLGARVVARYQVAFNGLCVEASPALLPRLARLPDVVSVTPVRAVHRDTSNTVPFVSASKVWSRLSVRGAGIRVAVIDSGIDYTHRHFGGLGTAKAYQTNNPRVLEPGSFPTARVVGGYDFVGDDYPNGGQRPDPDPLDPAGNGHGTHIAGIIAGAGVPGKIGPGVAPDAHLLAYKIYGRSGGSTQNIVLQALERAMDPDGDGSLDDRADVINISGGTSRQSAEDPLVLAADYAARLGTVVVGSAGNDGDHPYHIGGPGVAAGAISVGNSYGGGAIFDAVRVNTPGLGNLIAAEGALTAPLTPAGVTADVVYVGSASAGARLLSTPQGLIALVDRDGRPYIDKVRACQQAGAVGIIVINNAPGAPTTMPGDRSGVTIPGVMITRDDGSRLKAALSGGQRVSVTLSSRQQMTAPEWTDRIDDASSRGPRRGDSLIKPDVVAPGVNIVSAAAGSGDGGAADSGTSASAPVVAGIAALLRQLHPDWSVAEIKAAIVNTALPVAAGGLPYPISRQGAGRVQAAAAAAAQAVAIADDETPSLSFGILDEIDQPVTRRVTLINKSDRPQQFNARVDYLTAADAGGGVELTVTPIEGSAGRILLPPGEAAEVDVTLTVRPERLDPANVEYDGFVIFTEAGGATLRMPFLVVARTASAAEVSSLSGSTLVLKNSNPTVPAVVQVFTWAIDDPNDLDMEGDIHAVGVRSLVGASPATTRIEFAVTTHRPWTTPLGPQFTLLLDRDGNGRADLAITNDDAGVLAGGARSGKPGGVLRDAATGRVLAANLPVKARPHSGVMVFSVTAAQLGLTRPGPVEFWAQGWDPWRGDRQLDRTDHSSFDPFQPELTAIPAEVQFDRSATVLLETTADTYPGLLILFPNNPTSGQAQTLQPRDTASAASARTGRLRLNLRP